MKTHCLIGTTCADGSYVAQWVFWGEQPERLVPMLRQIWEETFERNIDAMVAALLAHEWAEISFRARPTPGHWLAVEGLGYRASAMRTVVWRGNAQKDRITAHLGWLYLIAPGAHQIEVYEATVHARWLLHSRHSLIDEPATLESPRETDAQPSDGDGKAQVLSTQGQGRRSRSELTYCDELCTRRLHMDSTPMELTKVKT